MMLERNEQVSHLRPAGQAVPGPRDSKPKAEETLIEEILKAAGLETLG